MLWAHLAALGHQIIGAAQWIGLAALWLGGLYSVGQTFKRQSGGRYPLWIYLFLAGLGFLGVTIFGVLTDALPRTIGLVSLLLFVVCWLAAVVLILLPKRKKTLSAPDYGPEHEGVWPPPPRVPSGENTQTNPPRGVR